MKPALESGLNAGARSAMRMLLLLMLICIPAGGIMTGGQARAAAADAPTVFRAAAVKPGTLVIHGSSTLHKWSITTHDLSGTAVIQLAKTKDGGKVPAQLQKIHLAVNVLSLRGSDGDGMDKTIYQNLNSRHDPEIMYTLTRAVLIATPGSGNPHYYFKAHGSVTAAGVSKRIRLVLAVLPLKNGGMTISTHTTLTFHDFGISPPTAMLGIIRAGKHLKITVTWNLVHNREKVHHQATKLHEDPRRTK